ncbi:NDMA-dependent alcohol dehydrogenase [Nocardia sp. NPDC052278]|uniref:NDMA-dependent alcohol dehydrogenase n=1 Tax=unclassified Nocardia TaxID=2637762 RepID=UPI00367BE360
MKTRAAVCWEIGKPWSVEELELTEPRADEVLIKMEYAGLCHSDDHNITGDFPAGLPLVGGHEGAGVVSARGSDVSSVDVGDYVTVTATPACGICPSCTAGRGWLCDANAAVMRGTRPDGSSRLYAADGRPIGTMAQLGTFSEYSLVSEIQVVKMERDLSPDVVSVLSCAVVTGWGAAVKCAQVRPGDVVAVIGVGGVGMSAVQGAKAAGASTIVAIDPVEMKRDMALKLGATHVAESAEAARPLIEELTRAAMADSTIVTVGVLSGGLVGQADSLTGKGGRTVLTSVAPMDVNSVTLPLSMFLLSAKSLVGNVYGQCNRDDIRRIVNQVRAGIIDVESMITQEYSLDQINDGYADMHAGKNVRGVIRF